MMDTFYTMIENKNHYIEKAFRDKEHDFIIDEFNQAIVDKMLFIKFQS